MSAMEATVDPLSPGSRLDADHPENGVLIPRRFTQRLAQERHQRLLSVTAHGRDDTSWRRLLAADPERQTA